MQTVSQGSWLIATGLLHNTDFEDTQVFLHQYNANDAVGFVVNRLFGRRLNELTEFAYSKPIPLYDGGPVDREHLFMLHRRSDMIPGGRPVSGNIYFGGDFALAVRFLNNGQLSGNDIRIFIGYCGWDKDQLEEEIAEGSWQTAERDEAQLFSL